MPLLWFTLILPPNELLESNSWFSRAPRTAPAAFAFDLLLSPSTYQDSHLAELDAATITIPSLVAYG